MQFSYDKWVVGLLECPLRREGWTPARPQLVPLLLWLAIPALTREQTQRTTAGSGIQRQPQWDGATPAAGQHYLLVGQQEQELQVPRWRVRLVEAIQIPEAQVTVAWVPVDVARGVQSWPL